MKALQLVLFALVWFAIDRSIHALFVRLGERRALPEAFSRGLERSLRIFFLVASLVFASQLAGLAPERLWAVFTTLAALLAVGFVAVWSVASNLLCALIIHTVRPFRIGDRIELFEPGNTNAGVSGVVIDIGAFYVVLAEEQSEECQQRLLIPNNIVMQRGVRLLRYAPRT